MPHNVAKIGVIKRFIHPYTAFPAPTRKINVPLSPRNACDGATRKRAGNERHKFNCVQGRNSPETSRMLHHFFQIGNKNLQNQSDGARPGLPARTFLARHNAHQPESFMEFNFVPHGHRLTGGWGLRSSARSSWMRFWRASTFKRRSVISIGHFAFGNSCTLSSSGSTSPYFCQAISLGKSVL